MQNTLTDEIERHVQRVMNTHSDFVWLSQLLHNVTGEYISPTTLKRLWGHQTDYCHPSPYTLNLLSRYLGYADYDAFKRGLHADYASSAIQTRCYMSANLSEGDVLTLTWRPDRRMLVRYVGNDSFEVVEVENSKLYVGDTFTCQSFVEGEMAVLSNLYHQGKGPFVYLIGKQGGVSITPDFTPPHQQVTDVLFD